MKQLTLLVMAIFISELFFKSCTPDNPVVKKEITPVIIKQNTGGVVYAVTISARDWQTINNVERLVDISITAISSDIINNGLVTVYLVQGDKHAILPFNYYQVRSMVSFQSSCKIGHTYINIFGNFLINIHEYYHFNIVVISPEMLNKYNCVKWNDFTEVKKIFKIKD